MPVDIALDQQHAYVHPRSPLEVFQRESAVPLVVVGGFLSHFDECSVSVNWQVEEQMLESRSSLDTRC
jgi:hypothetical protein